MTAELVIGDSVDTFHSFDQTQPLWMETVWFGAWIPEASISIYFYNWFRPVSGIFGGGCLIWDDRGELPWEIPVYVYEVNAPLTGTVDLRDMHLPTGNHLRALEEGQRYEMTFHNPRVDLAMSFAAQFPAEETTTEGAADFFNGHIDQAGHYQGRLQLEGKSYPIDCHGIRDRSWGPRVIGDTIRLGYFHGQSKDLAFLGYSTPGGEIEPVIKGYLLMDGEKMPLARGERLVHYKNGRLRHMDVSLVDIKGRTLNLHGRPLNRFVYLPYANLVVVLHLMEWHTPAGIVYGEEQDAWSVPLWQQRREIPLAPKVA
jgi:hypothetical protein